MIVFEVKVFYREHEVRDREDVPTYAVIAVNDVHARKKALEIDDQGDAECALKPRWRGDRVWFCEVKALCELSLSDMSL